MKKYPQHRIDRLADILLDIRLRSGASQTELAEAVGVNRTTIHNWENGISSPKFSNIISIFSYAHTSPVTALLEFIYPDKFWKLTMNDTDQNYREALSVRCSTLSSREKKVLAYGLKPENMPYIQLAIADLLSPIGDKQSVALAIHTSYVNAKESGQLISADIEPDERAFLSAIKRGQEAYKSNYDNYFSVDDMERYKDRMCKILSDTIGSESVKLARSLRVNIKTIESWMSGKTEPDFLYLCDIFEYFNVSMVPVLQSVFHAGLMAGDPDPDTDAYINDCIRTMDIKQIKQVMYVLYGDHGSLVYPFMQLMLELMLLPDILKKVMIIMIGNNYKNALARNLINDDPAIRPDWNILLRE